MLAWRLLPVQLLHIVTRSVVLSVCVRHKREPCKTAKPIEMLFGVWTRRGLGNHALVGGPGSPSGRGTFLGGRRGVILWHTQTYLWSILLTLTLCSRKTVSGGGISWAICKSAPRSRHNHASTPPLSFLQAGCPSCRPTNSVKALKG